jgi:integrase
MGTVWIFQRPEHIRKFGEDKASWYLGWYEPGGTRKKKSCGPGFLGKKRAEKEKHRIEEQLLSGEYRADPRKSWQQFRHEYETKVLTGKSPATKVTVSASLGHFERLVKPGRIFNLSTETIDEFIAARRQERGIKVDSLISPATVNHDLRHLKAALHIAVDWGYVKKLPKFRMEKEMDKLVTYVTGDDFAIIYRACEHARNPGDIPNVKAADWWRALLSLGYLTGWRIGTMVSLRHDRLDLHAGMATVRAKDTKGKREVRIKLHPVVIEHLRRIEAARLTSPLVLPWSQNRAMLYPEFARIQEKGGIHLACDEEHKHTRYCHVYSFHDIRRAFATMNHDKLSPDALQLLMQHKSWITTKKYINMGRQMDKVVESLHVPEVLKNEAR